ncbi:MAG: hypothetical protein HYW26_03000 [Candidatus Aenigmarchaeota archaeon]|nr:hypothetical protein [Candidatus Aenigmarchaeota archaeon]
MDMRKGVVKGFVAVSAIFLLALAVFFVANYVFTVFATASLSSNNVAAGQGNATFDTNQTGIDINITINITSISGGVSQAIQAIDVNITQAGFVNVTAENLRCPDSATLTWVNSSLTAGTDVVLRCANGTAAGAAQLNNTVTQLRIVGLTARNSPGTPTFNVSLKYNSSMAVENSTLMTLTILELQASSSLNDTTSRIDEQRSYNFTITNNATENENYEKIDEIRIDYTLSGFTDTGGANVTCPTNLGTPAWDLVNSSASNVIRCSKPASGGSSLDKGSSTNIVIRNWGASPIAQTRRFIIIVNGTNANGTYTVANQSSPSVVVNGTINVTGTSVTPSTVARNATNVTLMRYAFNTVGEQFNVSLIKLTLSGSAAESDFDGIRLVNDSNADGAYDATDTPVLNASALSAARQYEFVGNLRISDNNTLLLVANFSGSAVGGRTFRFNLNATSDIDSLGGNSGANVTESLVTTQSNQGTIHGTLVVKGYNLVPTTKAINTANLAFAYLEFNATGEGMNISLFNITRTGSATDSDVVLVRLFNDTNANAAFDAGTDTQLGAALNASSSSQYTFTGFQYNISAGSESRIFIVANITSATGGRLVSFGLNRTGDLQVVGAATNENFTATKNISFVTAQSGTTKIHGTLNIIGKALNPNTTAINTAGLAVLLLNFTAEGETINVTQINLTRTGSVTDGDGIFNVSLYNDTDRSGTWNSADIVVTNDTANALNVTTSSQYIFLTLNDQSGDLAGNGYNVTTAGSSLLVVVTTNASTSTGGKTFNLTLNGSGSVQAFTNTSAVNLTGSTNVTLTTTNGNLTTIFGTLAVSGTHIAPATADAGQLAVAILNVTFAATGEQMNITQINITLNNTNNNDASAVKLYNDTDRSGSVNAGDLLVATATVSGSIARFGTGAGQLFNVSAGAQKTMLVAYDINSTATGGDTLDAHLDAAGNLTVTSGTSGLSITASGTPVNPAGSTQVVALVATVTLDFTSTTITATDNYNFTIQNTGGEEINSMMIDYTASGYFDPLGSDVTCPTIAGGAWTKTNVTTINTLNCTSPGGANNLAVNGKANITVKNFQAGTSAGIKTFIVQVRGTSGGFFNATSSNVTVSGFLNITGANQIAAAVAVNSTNVSVIRYNFTASGEQMNITVIKLTRAGTSRESDIVSVKLFNDTNADQLYTQATDATQIGTTKTANNTGGQYEFTGLSFFVPTDGNMSLFAVVETGGTTSTGGKTLILNLNGTGDVNAAGSSTGANITENLTGTASTASTIFSKLVVLGKSLVSSTVGLNTSGLAVVQFNLTSQGGEQINITEINLSRVGSVVDGDVFNVSLYNDTDLSGTFNGGDTAIGTVGLNTTASPGLYRFTAINFNMTTATKTLFVVLTVNDTGSGRTFNVSINSTGSIHAWATTSNINLTGTTNLTLTTASSSTTTIAGGFTVTGKNLAPSTKVISTAGLPVLQLNFTATGEMMNVTVIKITQKGSVTAGEVYNVSLYKDTDASGTFNAGDTLLGSPQNTTSASQYVFTGFLYNITTTAQGNSTLFVIVTINNTAGNAFNLSLNSTGDIDTLSDTTQQNVSETITTAESSTTTIHGTLTVTGKTIAPLTKVIGTANLSVLQLNFTASGEAMNISLVNFSLIGTATEANLTNVRLVNDTNGNGQYDATTDTLLSPVLNTTSGVLFRFGSLTYFANTGGVNTIFVVVNITGVTAGTGGNFFNFSINTTNDMHVVGRSSIINITATTNITLTSTASSVNTTIHGTLNVTGKSLAISATTPSTANYTVMLINFTAVGEGMNITKINITRSGTATDGNFTLLRLFNDTDLSGTFNGGDLQMLGAINSSTNGEYVFSGLFNITGGASNTLILVINITNTASGGATFNFSVTGTDKLQVFTTSSNVNLTASSNITVSNVSSSTTTINSVTLQGLSLIETATNKTLDSGTGFYEIPSNEANIAVMRINLTAVGENMNLSVIKLTRAGSSGLSDDNIVNVRLFNDTNGNGRFDSGSDTQIGSAVNGVVSNKYELTGFQYNVTTSGVNTLFVVLNTTAKPSWNPEVYFNLSIASTDDVNIIGAVTATNMSETLTTVLMNSTKITYRGWYNFTFTSSGTITAFGVGWNSFTLPIQTDIEGTGRNASSTGNFNVSSIMSSLGSNWRYIRYNTNGSSTGWVLADRTDPGGSTLQYMNNTNSNPYWINMAATDRLEL